MARRANRKRKGRGASRLTTSAVALALGALSALGLWKCLDEGDGSPLAAYDSHEPSRAVDLGDGAIADPTLVDERSLLEAEERSAPGEAGGDLGTAEPEDLPEIAPGPSAESGGDEDRIDALFPFHGVAYHFHTQVLAEPRKGARVVSYARRGSTFRASERVSTEGCPRGWHEILGGGYVCDGAGVNVSRDPVAFAPSPPPADTDGPALPYEYAYARADDTPEYWRVPNPDEEAEVARLFEDLARLEAEGEGGGEDEGDDLSDALARAAEIAGEADPDAGADAGPDGGVVPRRALGDDPADPATVADGDADAGDPYALPPFLFQRMAKGYFVSVDPRYDDGGFQRTIRGRFVPRDRLYPASPSSFEGVVLDGGSALPLVFVVGGGVKLLRREAEDGPMLADERVARYEVLPFLGKLKRKGRRYVQVGEDLFLPDRVAAVAGASPRPGDVEGDERWIDIDLSEQTLVAYEGDTAVFATLVSTGREGFETPLGSFRIYNKHVSITMDDTDAGAEAYSIEDVPWTMYFKEGYALHAAFWHDRFGRVRSHGCVNLSPADARRLFSWTGPHVHEGLHGVIATRDNPGTRVVVHD